MYIHRRTSREGLMCESCPYKTGGLASTDTLQITDFKASEGWCTRFMKRHEYTLRAPTKVAQLLPQFWADKITEFQRFIIRHRRRNDYRLKCIGNMDETPMYMDMLPSTNISRSTITVDASKLCCVSSLYHTAGLRPICQVKGVYTLHWRLLVLFASLE